MGSVYKRGDSDGNWQIAFTDHTGTRVRCSSGTSDKTAAKRILAKLEADVALRKSGVIDPRAERLSIHFHLPITQHITEFQNALESHVSHAPHVRDILRVLNELRTAESWETLSEISPEGLERHAARLRDLGRSNRTIQRHISHARQFTRWLTRNGRLSSDPLLNVKSPSPAKDRKHERRPIWPEEWPFLRDSTIHGPIRRGMTPESRALLYELTIQTGLRLKEVESLTAGKFNLSANPSFVLLPASKTKNNQPARQFLTDSLKDKLERHLQTVTGGLPAFQLCDRARMARVVRADVDHARAKWLESSKTEKDRHQREQTDFLSTKDHEGRVIDFHALRHSCGAWLAMRGENPKTIQSIMRHSTITLTMDTYGHLFPAAESDAIKRLESLFM